MIAIPWVLKRTLPSEVYERREIEQVLNIPSSLLLALLLAIAAELLVGPIAMGLHRSSHSRESTDRLGRRTDRCLFIDRPP